MCTVTMPPRSMVYQTVGEKLPAASAAPAPPVTIGKAEKPKVSPAPVAMVPIRNWRRSTVRAVLRASLVLISGLLLLHFAVRLVPDILDGSLDADIRHAAAEVAVH